MAQAICEKERPQCGIAKHAAYSGFKQVARSPNDFVGFFVLNLPLYEVISSLNSGLFGEIQMMQRLTAYKKYFITHLVDRMVNLVLFWSI